MWDPKWRKSWYYEYNYEKQFPYTPNVRGIRTDRWKYIRYPHGDGGPDRHSAELFEIRSDPDETRNLIDDPQYAPVVVQLKKELEVFTAVNADANEMIEQKIEEISLLRLITDASSRAFLTQDPLELILGKVIGILGAENGSIMLGDNAEHLEARSFKGTCGSSLARWHWGFSSRKQQRILFNRCVSRCYGDVQ